jgi:hypothetical protein
MKICTRYMTRKWLWCGIIAGSSQLQWTFRQREILEQLRICVLLKEGYESVSSVRNHVFAMWEAVYYENRRKSSTNEDKHSAGKSSHRRNGSKFKSLLDYVTRRHINKNGILNYTSAKTSKLPQPTSHIICRHRERSVV